MVRPKDPRGDLYRANVHLSRAQVAALRVIARKTGVTASELIRRAIDDFLKRQK